MSKPPPAPRLDALKDEPNFAQLALFMGYAGQGGDFGQLAGAPLALDTSKEKERIASRLNGFNSKDTSVWKAITQRFGNNIKQPELLSMAQVLASHANIKLDRDAKRRKCVLVKWFEENWAAIEPYLPYVVLEDSQSSKP
jgi:hypothetical protein